MTDSVHLGNLFNNHETTSKADSSACPNPSLPFNIMGSAKDNLKQTLGTSKRFDFSYFDNTDPQDVAQTADTEKVMSGSARSGHTRNTIAPIMTDHDILFTTPDRKPPITPTTAFQASFPSIHPQETPSHRRKKRKIDQHTFPPSLQTPTSDRYYATPLQQQLPSPGIFGTQARSIRGGRPTPVQTSQFQTSTDQILLQLQPLPQILTEGMEELMGMITHLAQKQQALEKRIIRLERENTTLKGQNALPSPPQSNLEQETEQRRISTPNSAAR